MRGVVTGEGVGRWLRRAIAVVLGLAIVAWVLVRAPQSTGDKQPLVIDLPQAQDLASAGVEIDAALQRPLFWPERTPVAEQAVAAGQETGDGEGEAVPAEQTSFEFVATLLEGDQRFAIIRSQSSGIHRVHEGDNVDGWQVAAITPRGISLHSGQSALELEPPAKPTVTLSEVQKAAARRPAAAASTAVAGETPAAEEQVQGRGRENRVRENGVRESRNRRNRDSSAGEQTPGRATPEQMSEAMKALGERFKGFGQ